MVTHGWVMAKPTAGSWPDPAMGHSQERRQREVVERGGRERETEMATKTKMATGGVRISLPLAVGVDHGHP
jgi:hypothetical protein